MFPQAGVQVIVNAMLKGCRSIPTCKMVKTGALAKAKVWTKQEIVAQKFLLIDATPEQLCNETVRVIGPQTLTSLTKAVDRLIVVPEMVKNEKLFESV